MLRPGRPRGTGARGRRGGFSIVEIVVVLAVLAILAAVIGRNVVQTMNSGRASGLAQSLDALRQSIYQYRADVRRYPTNLSYLSTRPVAATDLCGRAVPAAFLDEWRGPYTPQTLQSSGIQVGQSTVLDAVELSTVFGIETTGTLFLVVEAVDSTVAADLEEAYDNPIAAGVYGTGMIRWTDVAPAGDGVGTLRFGLAVKGC